MKRETFTYKYRSVMGIDVGVTQEIERGTSRTKAIAKVKEDFHNSCTPLVELDGQQIDISDFLGNEILRLECDRNRLNDMIERLKKENKRRHPKMNVCGECGLDVDDPRCCQNDQDLWK